MQTIKWFVTDGSILSPGYPASIQIPHAMAAAWQFRNSFPEQTWSTVSVWYKLFGAYFCHGYGGSVVRDALLSRPHTIVAHETILSYFLPFGLLLVNYSPHDLLYKCLETHLHPLRLMMIAGEAVDATTSVCGAYELGLARHPGAPFAPFVAGLSFPLGGSLFRWFERRGRDDPEQITTWEGATPQGGLQFHIVSLILYHYARRWYGVRFARLWVTLLSVVVKLVNDAGPSLNPIWSSWNPLRLAYDIVYKKLDGARRAFKFGPQEERLERIPKV